MSVINNALSGLLAAQRGLATTSHNVANVNTPGYSRQSVLQGTRQPDYFGGMWIGSGTQVTDIRRTYDQFLVGQMRTATSGRDHLASFNAMASRLDNILGDPSADVTAGLQQFFAAVQAVSDDPASAPARQALLAQGDSLADRFALLGGQLDAMEAEINNRIQGSVTTINALARSIAEVNDRVAASAGSPPMDLLDQRDQLINELSTQVSVDVTASPDGSLNVFIGTGQSLVLGAVSYELVAQPDAFDQNRLQVAYKGASGGNAVVSNQITGGALGGTLSFRTDVLEPARNDLGQMALGLATVFNAQHALGVDLNGVAGGDFFSVNGPQVLAASTNDPGSTATVAATVSDIASLEAESYNFYYDGAAWQITDALTGQSVAASGTGTPADPYTFGGIEVVMGGVPVAGDQFQVRPTYQAATSLGTLITDPGAIAAAAGVSGGAAAGNTSNVGVSSTVVVDAALWDSGNYTITFSSPTDYVISDGAGFNQPGVYTPGSPIAFRGVEVELTGAPVPGDVFNVGPNSGGVGDNRNAKALADLQTSRLFGGGTTTLDDVASKMLTEVGTATLQSGLNLDAQSALRQQLELDVQSVSGVNLDEEAANLLKYQEAYQASARVLSAADEMFRTLLFAVGR